MSSDDWRTRVKAQKIGNYHVRMFPQVFIEVDKELADPMNWDIRNKLENHPSGEFEVRFMQLCKELNIFVDGVFSEKDLCEIAEECLKKLKLRKKIIVNSLGGGVQ
jgi:CRISPR/Cas system CSM-associated protein Csm5 (group 7 of RAMP superfamily)